MFLIRLSSWKIILEVLPSLWAISNENNDFMNDLGISSRKYLNLLTLQPRTFSTLSFIAHGLSNSLEFLPLVGRMVSASLFLSDLLL